RAIRWRDGHQSQEVPLQFRQAQAQFSRFGRQHLILMHFFENKLLVLGRAVGERLGPLDRAHGEERTEELDGRLGRRREQWRRLGSQDGVGDWRNRRIGGVLGKEGKRQHLNHAKRGSSPAVFSAVQVHLNNASNWSSANTAWLEA